MQHEELRQRQPINMALVPGKASSSSSSSSISRPEVAEVWIPNVQRVLARHRSYRKHLPNTNVSTLVQHNPTIVQSLKDLSYASRSFIVPDSEGLQLLLQDLAKIIPHISPVQLANVAWALASLAEHTEISLEFLFELTVRSCTRQLLMSASDRDIAKLVWMLTKVGVRDPALYSTIADVVVSKIESFTLQNISLVAWGYAKARLSADLLFTAIKKKANLTTKGHLGREFACLAAAYETRMPHDRDFFDKLTGVLLPKELPSFNEKSLANLLGSYTIAGIFPRPLFEAAFKMVRRKENFEARDCVKIAIAFARSGLPSQEATELLTEHIRPDLTRLSPYDLSLLMWALSTNESYRDTTGFTAHTLENAVFPFLDNFSRSTLVTVLYSLIRQRYDPLPEVILNKVLDPTFLPAAPRRHQLMAAWMLSVLRSDLRQLLPPSKARRQMSKEEFESTLLGPMGDIASEEKGRLFIIRLGNILRDLAGTFDTSDSLAGYSPPELACLTASLAMSAQSRDAFQSLWVPTVLERMAFGDPLFKESILLLLSSYVYYGTKSSAHLGRILNMIKTVHKDYHGRDLAHLTGVVNLLGLPLPLVFERAQAQQSSIDPGLHRLLTLIPRQYNANNPPREFVLVHKQLLSEVMGKLQRPMVQDMFDLEFPEEDVVK